MKSFQTFIFILTTTFLSNTSNAQPAKEYQASTTELTFNVNGNRLSGFIYQTAGKGLHPTVLLLHGYPGNEKNLDVAQALRNEGWNVVFFHYRGAWGSEGEFSFMNAEHDVQAVLKYLTNKDNATKLGIDRNLLSIVGHSMGGHMAIAGILDNPSVTCAIAYDGANMGVGNVGIIDDPETKVPWKEYSDTLFMLNGWSGEKAQEELRKHSKKFNLVNRVNTINARPVLLVAADSEVIPLKSHIEPLLKALQKTKGSNVSYKLIKDDHSFNSSRTELINTTINFLNSNCMAK